MQTVVRQHIDVVTKSLVKRSGEHFKIFLGLLGNARTLDLLGPKFVANSQRFDDIRKLALLRVEDEDEIRSKTDGIVQHVVSLHLMHHSVFASAFQCLICNGRYLGR